MKTNAFFGKIITNTKSVVDKINNDKSFKKETIFQCLSICSESVYCLVDHVILLHKIGAWKFSDKTMKFVVVRKKRIIVSLPRILYG